MDLTAREIARRTGGEVIAGDPARRFLRGALDSRHVARGALFIALPGARSDGHDFVARACAAGAAGALVTRPDVAVPAGAVVIQVPDTTLALQALGASWRDELAGALVGIAGSNGKTTTKEAVAAVLAQLGTTAATRGNANSQVSAPLTLLDVPREARFAVLELGTSAPGELTRLAAMARPDLCIITAAFAEHLEGLGSLEGVIAAECEILSGLRPGGRALIGSAEPRLAAAARALRPAEVRTLGTSPDDDWQLAGIGLERNATSFELRDPAGRTQQWRVPLLGAPAAWAGAFAVATARELVVPGAGPEATVDAAIERGLKGLTAPAHRLAPRPAQDRPWFVLDDSYNSNPASLVAAVETAVAIRRADERLALVVGDMLELGPAERELHREVGRMIARLVPPETVLVAVGPLAVEIAAHVGRADMVCREVADARDALAALRELVPADVKAIVLAKGSRGIALDRVADALAGPDAAPSADD